MACFHVWDFCDSKSLEIQDPNSCVLTPGPNAFPHDPSCGDMVVVKHTFHAFEVDAQKTRKFISLSQDVSILWKETSYYT